MGISDQRKSAGKPCLLIPFSIFSAFFEWGMISWPNLPIYQLKLSLRDIPALEAKARRNTFMYFESVGINSVPGPKRLKTNTPTYPNFRKGSGLTEISAVRKRRTTPNIKTILLKSLELKILTHFSLSTSKSYQVLCLE